MRSPRSAVRRSSSISNSSIEARLPTPFTLVSLTGICKGVSDILLQEHLAHETETENESAQKGAGKEGGREGEREGGRESAFDRHANDGQASHPRS